MSFVLEFLPEASAEVECATGDYEARAVGLGTRFRSEIEIECAGDCSASIAVALTSSRIPAS